MGTIGTLTCLLIGLLTLCHGKIGNPVILIPGDGGTQLYAKLDKPKVVHYFCTQHTDDYFSLWLNIELLAPYVLDCTVDNFRLVYNPVTKRTTNSPGVEIAMKKFGDPAGVEFLDPSKISVSSYFAPLAIDLRLSGYEDLKNLFGASFDFRKAPNEMEDFFVNLTKLFEHSYDINGQPALAVAHSLGNMVFTYFMSSKTQSWKDKYVSGYVALSAPLGGAAKAFRLYASGDTLGQRLISAIGVRPMQRTFPSSAFVIPVVGDGYFWNKDDVFITTPTRNYTIADIPTLAKDIDFPYLYDMWMNSKDLVNIPTMHPGVPVYCIHGWNISTPERFEYTGSMFPDSPPNVQYGQGDGTVNAVSLLGCDLWKDGKWKFNHTYVPQGEHNKILANLQFIHYIRDILGI